MLTSFDPRQEPLLREHRAGAQLEIGNPPRHGQLVERRLAQPQIVCSLVEPEQLLGGRRGSLGGWFLLRWWLSGGSISLCLLDVPLDRLQRSDEMPNDDRNSGCGSHRPIEREFLLNRKAAEWVITVSSSLYVSKPQIYDSATLFNHQEVWEK